MVRFAGAGPVLEIDMNERALSISGFGFRLTSGYVGIWATCTMKAAGIERPGNRRLLRHS